VWDAGNQALLMQHFAVCEKRLRELAHLMLLGFPSVRRWEDTDDILQESLIRLNQSLADEPPDSEVQFLRLSAHQIRRVLINLARRYSRRDHFASNHETWAGSSVEQLEEVAQTNDSDELTVGQWSEFHEQVEALPAVSRELWDLIWYMGLSQREAANLLELSERSVQRRWREARVLLHRRLADLDEPSQ
jgi:RNA polymerase sigma factor (sigma-70 family)